MGMDQFHGTRCIKFDLNFSFSDVDPEKMVDFLFELKGLQVVRFKIEFGFTISHFVFEELLKRENCFEYLIITNIIEEYEKEYSKSFINLLKKFPKTRFIYRCYKSCIFENIERNFNHFNIEKYSNPYTV